MNKLLDSLTFKTFTTENAVVLNIDPVGEPFNIVDIIFHMRIVQQDFRPVICLGFLTIPYLMRDPQYAVLFSKGVRYLQLPFSNEEFQKTVQKIDHFNKTDKISFKPYVKLRIEELLAQFKHRYFNYTGMFLMLMVKYDFDRERLRNKIPDNLRLFLNDLSYNYLSFYYGFEELLEKRCNLPLINHVFRESNTELLKDKKVLLVDDQAKEGWHSVLAEMLWNNADSENIRSVNPANDLWEKNLESGIQSLRPHLILLDLRLNNETGKQSLVDLEGYKLLKWLKKSRYKGIPVIIFTASSNAENVKTLLEEGAEAVWTKPGFEDGITAKSIIERYDKLTEIVENTLNRFYNIDEINWKIYREDFVKVRSVFFKKFDNIKTRVSLNIHNVHDQNKLIDNNLLNFHSYTNIIIDTCTFISNSKVNTFINTFCNILILTLSSKKYTYQFQINGSTKRLECPRIIILNDVLDELYKHSKVLNNERPLKWKYALLAYETFRVLINDGLARTEINAIDIENNPVWVLNKHPFPYADDVIIKEIHRIHTPQTHPTELFRLKKNLDPQKDDQKKFIKINATRLEDKGLTLIVTDDGDLRKRIDNENFSDVTVLNITEFNKKLNEIKASLVN